MTALFYILQSAVQVLGVFYLSFSLFRFKLRSYLGESAFFSLLIGVIICFLRVFLKMELITPSIVCFLMILFMWLVIKIPVFYSTLMIVMGYLGIFIVESLLISTCLNLNILSWEQVHSPFSLQVTVLILLTNSILYLLGWWLYRKGFGFSFSFKPIGFKKETIGFLFAILLSVAVAGLFYYSTMHFGYGLLLATVTYTVSFCTLLFLSFRKEYKEYD